MIKIEIDFDRIQDRLYQLVDDGLDFAYGLQEDFNKAFGNDTPKFSLDMETYGFDKEFYDRLVIR